MKRNKTKKISYNTMINNTKLDTTKYTEQDGNWGEYIDEGTA